MKRNITVIAMILALVGLFGVTMYSFFDNNTISTKENRTLSEFPIVSQKKWFSGELSKGFESYFNDHVYKRDDIIDKAGDIEYLMKVKQDMEINLANGDRKDIGSDVLILQDRIIPLYLYDEGYFKVTVEGIKGIFKLVPQNVEKYLMITPSRCEFEDEEYKQYCDSQADVISQVYANTDDEVNLIDSYSSVAMGCQDVGINEMFFRTDHHWTHHGAVYGANALLLGMGLSAVNPNGLEKKGVNPFMGYLVAMHEDASQNIEPDTIYYYDYNTDINEDAYGVEGTSVDEGIHELMLDESRAGYYTFIERSYQYVVIDGGKKNGDVLLMINDSYANTLVPWIADQFKTVIMVDPRLYKEGKNGLLGLIDDHKVNKFMINIAAMSFGGSFGEQMADLTK